MKKLSLLLLILISCLAVVTGCSEDPKKKYLSLLDPSSEDTGSVTDPDPEPVFNGPSSVTATDGNYKTKVGINWATVTDAVSYNIYRADNIAGPFTTKIKSINASDLINVDSSVVSGMTPDTVTTTATSGTCDVRVMQTVYTSNVDLSIGFLNHPTESENILIQLGNSSPNNIYFGPGFLALGKIWSRDEVIAKFNEALGSNGQCIGVTVDGKQCIRITLANAVTLRLQNNNGFLDLSYPLFASPLKKIIDGGANWETTIEVNPVMIGCNDTTRPTVFAVSPASGATGIALNTKLSVAFSEPINQSTLNESSFTLSAAGGSPVAGTVSNTGVFTPAPDSELSSNTEYTATITTAVKDLAGNNLASNYVWKFTTSAGVLYYYVDTAVTEGNHYYYAITAVDKDGKESKLSPVEEGFTKANENAPSKVPSCSASDGLTGGITVTWTAAIGATYYKVYRIDSAGQTQVGGTIAGLSYTDTTVGPGVFSYKVAPFNTFGEGGSSEKDAGFRTVSDYEFFDLVYAEEESGLNRINHLKQSGQGMLGSETVNDLNGNGKCDYNASYDIWTGMATVTTAFTDFCDIFLILNGTQTTQANSSATGTISGQINITGIYPGYVKFNLNITGGTASGGTYTVKQSGGVETTIPGTYVPAD